MCLTSQEFVAMMGTITLMMTMALLFLLPLPSLASTQLLALSR
jgi:hypothetical protein